MELVLSHLFISLPLGLVREGGCGSSWGRRMSEVGLVIHFCGSICLHDFPYVGLWYLPGALQDVFGKAREGNPNFRYGPTSFPYVIEAYLDLSMIFN